jgi:chromate transport protein ChrA
MMINFTKSTVIHPFLFAIFPIIATYAINMQELLPIHLLQPLAIILVFTIIITLIAKIVFKNWLKVGLIVSLIIGLVFSYGHIYFQISGFALGDFVIGRHTFLIIPYIITFFIGSYYIFKTNNKFENITKILNAVAITLILISVINITTYAIENDGLGIITLENDVIIEKIGSNINSQDKEMMTFVGDLDHYPDVYFLILDGYGGASSLKNDLNYDNSKFIQVLEEKGFFVASKSFSNYPQSFLSIPSTMNMKYLNYLKDVLKEESKDQLTGMKMMNNFLVMEIFKEKGYKTVNFLTSDFEVNADHSLCEDKYGFEGNELTQTLTNINIFQYFSSWLQSENIREQQECYFSELPEIHKKFQEPVFVFAHIMLPHPPNVFGPNGEHVIPRIYYNEWGTQEDKDRYLDTLQYANLKLLEFIEKVLNETDHQPIIIIESDHGTDFNFDWNEPTNKMLKQRFSNLNAYYMPEGQELLYDTITPVNSFRIMFNSNFNGNFELLEDKAYWSTYHKPYKFEDVTEILKNP